MDDEETFQTVIKHAEGSPKAQVEHMHKSSCLCIN